MQSSGCCGGGLTKDKNRKGEEGNIERTKEEEQVKEEQVKLTLVMMKVDESVGRCKQGTNGG